MNRQVAEPAASPTTDFNRFYREEYRSLLRMAYVLCGDRHLAEEVVQEAFLAAYRRWGELAGYERAWIRRVVANRAMSLLRRMYAEGRAWLKVGSPRSSQLGELPEESGEFWRQVRSLPRRQAQALVLFYVEGYSTREIGQVLGCSETTVRVHMHRGRRALRRRLGITEERP